MNSFVFTYDLNDIDKVAQEVLALLDKGIVLMKGEMGSGKTTLVSALIKALGGEGQVSSPTFSIVNEYETEDGTAYHFDLYRINSINEALNVGIEEYLDYENWLFMEWPDRIAPLLPSGVQCLTIRAIEHNKRSLKLTINKTSLTGTQAMTDSKF